MRAGRPRASIDLDRSPSDNLRALAEAKGVYVEDLTVVILDRPRHVKLVEEVRRAGARIKLIGDGDVSAALATTMPEAGIDLLLGTGRAPQGIIAAAALSCLGGDMQARAHAAQRVRGRAVPGARHLRHAAGSTRWSSWRPAW